MTNRDGKVLLLLVLSKLKSVTQNLNHKINLIQMEKVDRSGEKYTPSILSNIEF